MGKFNCPIEKARLTSPFGWRNDPFGKGGKYWHQGCDLASPIPGKKVTIYASASGTVTKAQSLSTYGNVVMILHSIDGKTYETNYAHLDSYSVKVGQQVQQGQQIGIMGTTGSSTAVHLHFEIHEGRYAPGQPKATDPMKWIKLDTYTPVESKSPQPKKDYSKQLGYSAPKDSKVYRLHTGAYKSKELAEKAQADLVKQGYLGYAEVFGNKDHGYRIQSGKYLSQKACEQTAIKMLDAGVIGFASIIGSQQ